MAGLTWNLGESNRLFVLTSGPTGRYLAGLAVKVESGAKQRCPVDTGRLRSSITWRLEQGAGGRDSGGRFTSGGLAAIIGTNLEYGYFVHQGTRYMTGRPFLTDALHAVVG